jgi:hypothetical protein
MLLASVFNDNDGFGRADPRRKPRGLLVNRRWRFDKQNYHAIFLLLVKYTGRFQNALASCDTSRFIYNDLHFVSLL